MAKTGFWLRGAKGKLAGTTLYRGRTGTVQREIVSPTNPKSGSMMLQRALFAAVAKFYSNGQKALFKFAYEDKKANHTDFNAFMQANVKRGCYFPQSVVTQGSYPMVGFNYLMAKGSLPSINTYEVGDNGNGDFGLLSNIRAVNTTASANKVSAVSKDLIAAGYLQGDIITVVGIISEASYDRSAPQRGYMTPAGSTVPPTWIVRQFEVNTGDDRLMSDIGFAAMPVDVVDDDGAAQCINFSFPDVPFSDEMAIVGGAIVVSRNSSEGLKVSTTLLSMSEAALMVAYKASKIGFPTESYTKMVADSWGAKSEAILKGGLHTRAASVAPAPVATSVQGASELINTTIGIRRTAVGEAVQDDPSVGDSAWIRVNGENLGSITESDVSLSVPATQGEITDVIATDTALFIKVLAKATSNNVNVRCDKLGGTICKVTFV